MANSIKIVKAIYTFKTRQAMLDRVLDRDAWEAYKKKVLQEYPTDHDLIWDLFTLKINLIQKKKL